MRIRPSCSQGGISALGGDELVVGTDLDHSADVEDDDEVSSGGLGQAVGDHQRGATFQCSVGCPFGTHAPALPPSAVAYRGWRWADRPGLGEASCWAWLAVNECDHRARRRWLGR